MLQDQEFERLGSTRTIRVNVRLVAATNLDLAKSIAEGQFRSDLFYRLHVFPIRMPPLRERRQDIPALVRYFVQKLARRMGKQIDTIPIETMNKMMDWNWPGNIRELENLVERSVILTKGSILHVSLAELRPQTGNTETDGTLERLIANTSSACCAKPGEFSPGRREPLRGSDYSEPLCSRK
jgi:formate hydrogenlyase transcriptional activator